MLTIARISPRNIYLNSFGGAHFQWRSPKARNIAKRTCLNYVWTAIFLWSYFSLKLEILCLFRARCSKTVECRFTLKRQKQPPEVFCKISQNSQESTSARASFLKKKLWHRCFPVNFAKFLRTTFYRILPDDCFFSLRDMIIIYSYSCKKFNQPHKKNVK